MLRFFFRYCLSLSLVISFAQDIGDKKPGVYIVFDASGSMWGEFPDKSRKIEVAKKVLADFLTDDFKNRELAFRVYGHRQKADCQDSELLVPFGAPAKAAASITRAIETLNPLGQTPIGFSLKAALEDFGERSGGLILISDGQETCGVDPCALMRVWRKENVNIQVHVVGLGLDQRSKKALECIARAADGSYYNANSATELAARLGEIRGLVTRGGFYLKGFDGQGAPLPVLGTVSRGDEPPITVTSHRRFKIEPGSYALTAGVETKNGNLYRPVTQEIQVVEGNDTIIKIHVPTPPTVKAVFLERGKEMNGSLVHAYQADQRLFQFRWMDEVFVDEGEYEFRAKPNRENDLSVTATITAGEHKKIVFEMTPTVHVKVKMTASGSGIWYRDNYELRQGGKRKYLAHAINGVRMLPGVYDIWLDNNLTPFVKRKVVISNEEEQVLNIVIPSGHVTVIYQKADGKRDKDKRFFLGRGAKNRGGVQTSGIRIPLTPGTYNATGWQGDYEQAIFTIQAGDEKDIVLKLKK